MYSIEKGIPHPVSRSKKLRASYPFAKMEEGDSFYVEGEQNFERVRVAAINWGRRNGCQFITRREGSGVRCWLAHDDVAAVKRSRVAPYHTIDTGESCFIPAAEVAKEMSLRVTVCSYGRRRGKTFSVRKGSDGYNITRIA